MHIQLTNKIQLTDQLEVIDQMYTVEVAEKNGLYYLIFTNEEDEKVMIKAGEKELVMTRFSTPKSVLRFVQGKEIAVVIPTPMGLQHFVTDTHRYSLSHDKRVIQLHYALKTLKSKQIFALYQMTIRWFK